MANLGFYQQNGAGVHKKRIWLPNCGATLLTSKFLLTAAHCFKNNPIFKVVLGDNNLGQPSDNFFRIERNIKNIFTHPKFQKNDEAYYDVAIIELDQEVVLNDFIQPICLPPKHGRLNREKKVPNSP
jgi:V8-like Glu-specific endopeptidase